MSSVQTAILTAYDGMVDALATLKSVEHVLSPPQVQAENHRKYWRAMRILRGLQCKKRNNKVILFHTVQRDKHEGADI